MFPIPDELPADAPLWVFQILELIAREVNESELAERYSRLAEIRKRSKLRCGSWEVESFPQWTASPQLPRRTLPGFEECAPVDEAFLCRALDLLRDMHPSFEVREGQIQMAGAVLRSLNEGRHLLLEAGTGVGKTLGYLIPAALWACQNDVPIVVSTNTRNLQAQILAHDLPIVHAILKELPTLLPLRYTLLKGRSNYLCLQRLSGLLDDAMYALEREDLIHLAKTIVWSISTHSGDLEELSGKFPVSNDFLQRLNALPEACSCSNCRFAKRCFLRHARAEAIQAHILVVNHALVFADLASGAGILPPHHQLILDEAHNTIDVATTHLSASFEGYEFDRWLRLLAPVRKATRDSSLCAKLYRELPPDSPHPEIMREDVKRLRQAGNALLQFAQKLLPKDLDVARVAIDPTGHRCVFNGVAFVNVSDTFPEGELQSALATFSDACGRLGATIRSAQQSLVALRGGSGELEGSSSDLLGQLAAVLTKLDDYNTGVQFLIGAADSSTVYWVERTGKSGSWHAAPLMIAQRLSKELFSRLSTAVLTSATLQISKSFKLFAQNCGIGLEADKLDSLAVGSPFNYLLQCRAFALGYFPDPTQFNAYTEALSKVIVQAARHHRGRTLVLFTSHQMLQATASLTEPLLQESQITLLQQTPTASRERLTRQFLELDSAVLFGLNSFWEGFDVPGERLSCVIITRLPFPTRGDPVLEARGEAIRKRGKLDFAEYTLPEAIIHFRQGFGRLIRATTDRGDIIITDSRIVTQRYGTVFRRSIPATIRTVNSSEELLTYFPPQES